MQALPGGARARALVAQVRVGLVAAAEPDKGPRMQAYMKSEMPYLGVRVPRVRAAVKESVGQYPVASIRELCWPITELWRNATFREHRYAAIELLHLPIADGELAFLGLCEEMTVTGAWWDYVDGISPRVSQLLEAHPTMVRQVVLCWSRVPDRWLRRVSIIAQLAARDETDVDLLPRVIDANLGEADFFVRKAIGWALREYGKTDAEWVRKFVNSRQEHLSKLSQREVLKNLG